MGTTRSFLRTLSCAVAVALLSAGAALGSEPSRRSRGDDGTLSGHMRQARAKAHQIHPSPRPAPRWQLVEPLEAPTMEVDPYAPVVDVAGEAATADVVTTDLDPTIDVQITQEIIDLAAELGSPEAMYEFVRNEVEFQAYYGSQKGSVETLHQRAGNDYDQASLLIALLRAEGIPARYAVGMVEMPVDRATNWLTVDDGTVAGSILYSKGMEAVVIVSGPDVVAVRCRRVWVEAFTARPFGPPAWVPLDPAFALHTIDGGPDIPEEMGFDYQAFVEDYYDPAGGGVTLPRPETLVELFELAVSDYLSVNHPGLTLADASRSAQIVAERLGMLPASLPYTVRSRDEFYSEIPADRRYQIRFHLYQGGTELLDRTVNLPEIAGRRVTISYVGATPADQAIIDANNGLLFTPPNEIDITPVLKVDGVEAAAGLSGIGAGIAHNSDMHFLAPVNGQGLPVNVVPAIYNTIIAGEYQAIGLSVHGVSDALFATADPLDTEDFRAQLKHAGATAYLERCGHADARLGELMHAYVIGDVDNAIMKDQLYVAPDRSSWAWRGLTVDADRSVLGVWKVDAYQPGCASEGTDVLTLGGAQGSLNESSIFEDDFAHEAVSTIKILELAVDQGITVYHRWDSTTLPPNTLSPSVQSAIQSAIASGHVVTFPADPITYFNWTGTGYIDMDPCTGAAGYIIAGGQSGGSTVDSWTELLPVDPDKTIDCIEGDVTVPAADSPDPSSLFCSNSTTRLHFEYRLRVKYTDGTSEPWQDFSHDSLAPSAMGAGHYRLTVGNCGADYVRLFTVVSVAPDTVTGGDSIGTNGVGQAVYATAQGAGDVVITLKSDPAGVTLPNGWVTWTGGTAGATQLSRSVSKGALNVAGEDVTATVCGEETKYKVYVFEAAPVAAPVTLTMTRTRDDTVPGAGEFGAVDFNNIAAGGPTNTYNIYYENKKWKFVFEQTEYEVPWGVHDLGRTDVPDGAANPFPLGMGMPAGSTEAQKKTQAKADLTPNASGRAPRSRYWAQALTEQHEIFHMDDWETNYARPKMVEAETTIEAEEEAVTLANLDPVAVLNAKRPDFDTEVDDKNAEAWNAMAPGAETRAYADGRGDYQALADSIVP